MRPHAVLGITPSASKDEAKRAYRKLVKQHHPDTGGDAEKFKQITEAYDHFVNPTPPKPEVRVYRPPQKNKSIHINYAITLNEVATGVDQDVVIRLPNGKQQLVHLVVPAGIHNKQTVVFRGLGDNSNRRLLNGDLHVTINVKPHRRYRRQGNNLQSNLELTKKQAKEGCRMRIPSLAENPYILNVPAGIRDGQVMRYGGFGLPIMNTNRRGDLLVNISVK